MITQIDQALNQAVRCTDGDIRRLTKIEPDYLSYDIPIIEWRWLSLGRTYRSQAEPLFIGGEILRLECPRCASPTQRHATDDDGHWELRCTCCTWTEFNG